MTLITDIHAAAARRQANWSSYPRTSSQLTVDLTDELELLYARRRKERAQRRHGPTAAIVRRARVEREIERLAATNGS